jgi:hypothetical protein
MSGMDDLSFPLRGPPSFNRSIAWMFVTVAQRSCCAEHGIAENAISETIAAAFIVPPSFNGLAATGL